MTKQTENNTSEAKQATCSNSSAKQSVNADYETVLEHKYQILTAELQKIHSVVIGFSGGVDSTFLVTVAGKILGDKAVAVIVASPFCPQREMTEAKAFAAQAGVNFHVIQENPLAEKRIAANPPDRCYYCKKLIFGNVLKFASEQAIKYVADGSNADDEKDYRPGLKALKELKIISPLQLAGLTKADIRALSRKMGLPTWQKESAACLASRIPYGEIITGEKLVRVDKAENYLRQFAFSHLRVRSHGDLARLEVGQPDMAFFANPDNRIKVAEELKKLGFNYVALDLEGYRTGSLNEVLPK